LLDLVLFGGFRAGSNAGGPVSLPMRKSRAVLAYLALHPDKAQPREHLAGLLWSDRAERQAHNSLSQAVTPLRKALAECSPAPLRIEADSITFVSSAAEVDVLTFERLLASGTPADLERAEALYRGDLLDAIGVRDPVFEEWLGFERERLRGLAVGALNDLLTHRCEEDGPERLVATAQRLLKFDPFQEKAHRALMRCYMAQGQTGLALRQYDICAGVLEKELGVKPEEETRRLHGEIFRQRSVLAGDATGEDPKAPEASVRAQPEAARTRPRFGRWPLAAAVAAALLFAGLAVFWEPPWGTGEKPASIERMAYPLPEKPSIVVLPFLNLSDDPSQAYFADGMTDDLITDLAKISGMFVISRNSAFAYREDSVRLQQVAEELGVRYVLEGSVRRVGDDLRINAQLIDATTGGHLWAERYDGPLADVFALQDRVTERIVEALALELLPDEARRIAASETDNAAAHDAYLLGLSFYKRRTPQDNAEAAASFEKAIRLDPDYAAAHTALAKAYIQAVIGENAYAEKLGIFWTEGYTKAWTLLEKGMARPNADVHVLRSWLALNKHQYEQAIMEARRALDLNPNDAEALEALAEALIYAGQPAAGTDYAQRAKRQNPSLLGRPSYLMGLAEFHLENPQMAVRHVEQAIRQAPGNEADFSGLLAAAYGSLGLTEQAEKAFEAYSQGFLNRPALAWSAGSVAFSNPRFHTWRRIGLAWSVYSFPFAEGEVLERLAAGLATAGAPRGVGGYLSLDEANRLSGPEIERLLLGKEIKGKDFWLSEFAWRQERSHGGEVTHAGYPVHAGLPEAAAGVARIEDDRLCEQWPSLTTAFEICVVLFRVSDSNARVRWGDYVMVTDTGPHPFSVID
jgi:TolB-like protein/DNA-binding SARP family transcriptional activator